MEERRREGNRKKERLRDRALSRLEEIKVNKIEKLTYIFPIFFSPLGVKKKIMTHGS